MKKYFIFFTISFLLFMFGCGKTPLLSYLPEQKSISDTSEGKEETSTIPTLKLDIPIPTGGIPSITIKAGENPKIEWVYSDSIANNTYNYLLITILQETSSGGSPKFWEIGVYNDIKNTTSVVYGSAPSGAATWTIAKTLVKGEYSILVRVYWNNSFNSALGNGTIKVE